MKPSWNRVAAAAASAWVLGIAAPACAQKVTLDVLYAQPGFAKYHEPIAEAFMKAHPDVEIQVRGEGGSFQDGTASFEGVEFELPQRPARGGAQRESAA